MGKPAKYQPISSFWTIVVPGMLIGLIYYAYNSPGWLSLRVQSMLNPIIEPVMRWINSVF